MFQALYKGRNKKQKAINGAIFLLCAIHILVKKKRQNNIHVLICLKHGVEKDSEPQKGKESCD